MARNVEVETLFHQRQTTVDRTCVFTRRGWLSTASAAHRERILAAGRSMAIARGQRLVSPGDPPGGIFGVISGGIAIEASTAWHPARLGHVFREGHWFGHGPALNGGLRPMGYVALERSLLWTIPLPRLSAMMREDLDVARLVGELANAGTVLGCWVACDLLVPEAPRRIAAVLLRVTGAHEGVEPGDPQGFLLTQAVLGEMANASRHHANRVLGQFADRGWIATTYSRIRILDVAALAAFAYRED